MDKATLALIISALSLLVAFWNMFRDRSRLHISSKFFPKRAEYGPAKISFKAINKGRRPIYIRMVGGNLKQHGWVGTQLTNSEFGMKLEEGQYYEAFWTIEDIYESGPDFDDEYKDIWLEDSHGRRHKVPKASKYIKMLKTDSPLEE